MKNDSFGDRMKRYEQVTDVRLTNLTPVILRLDGRAFHTLTKRLEKPYDVFFSQAMTSTMWHLIRTVQNCVFGFTQSDEISLLLIEPTYLSDSWFDNRLQKVVSIASAEASTFFRDYVRRSQPEGTEQKYAPFVAKAVFDCRAFNVPVHEVANYFIWRQMDCARNAVAGAGQANFSQKELNGLNSTQIINKLSNEKNIDFFNDYPQSFIWGKIGFRHEDKEGASIDTDCIISAPNFKEDRFEIERHLPDYLL